MIVAEETVRDCKAKVPPTAPVNVVVPDPAVIVAKAVLEVRLLIVLSKVTLPLPVLILKVSPAGIVTGPRNVNGPLVVIMLQVVTAPV